MAENARLQIVLRLKDEASKRMKNIDKSFKQSAKRIGTAAAGGAVAAGAGFVAVGKGMQSFGDGVKLAENALRLGTGAMGDDLDALMGSTRAVSGQVPQDFKTVATAIADVSTEFGLVGKPLEETTQMFLDVARVAGLEAGPMIKGVNDTMSIFGDDTSQTNRILGDFVAVAQDTGTPLAQLISDMTTYGPILKNAGMETDEAAAFIGSLTKNGIDASRVFPGLKKRLKDLAEAGVDNLSLALENDIKFIQSATTKTEGLNRAAKTFGSEGADRMLAAINAGLIPANEALVEKLRGTDDEVANLTDGTMTTSEQLSVMKNKVMAVIAPFADYIALIGAILVPLGMLAIAIGGVALAGVALNISFLPLIAIIAAVIAAVVLAVVIFKNWDKIVAALGVVWGKVWGGIKKVFDIVWGALDSKIGKLIALFIPGGALLVGIKFLAENWDTVWSGMVATVKGAWGLIKLAGKGVLTVILAPLRGFLELVNQIITKIPGFVRKRIPGISEFEGFLSTAISGINSVTAFAHGGIVTRPTLGLLGEAGPEAIVPLRPGAGMGTTVNINFPQGSTVILDNESSARALADQITQQIRGVLRAQGAF